MKIKITAKDRTEDWILFRSIPACITTVIDTELAQSGLLLSWYENVYSRRKSHHFESSHDSERLIFNRCFRPEVSHEELKPIPLSFQETTMGLMVFSVHFLYQQLRSVYLSRVGYIDQGRKHKYSPSSHKIKIPKTKNQNEQ